MKTNYNVSKDSVAEDAVIGLGAAHKELVNIWESYFNGTEPKNKDVLWDEIAVRLTANMTLFGYLINTLELAYNMGNEYALASCKALVEDDE